MGDGGLTAGTLGKSHMPEDYSISLAAYTAGSSNRLIEDPEKRGPEQRMRGFESTYRNVIDYIVRITYRIWEQKNIGYIYDTYAEDSRVYDDYGLQRGSAKIVADTSHTINAFPGIELIADEIVWAGDDEVGFHTSHRTLIRGHNTGYSKYGPPTDRYIDVWCIANCVSLENQIFLEHVLYNNSSMLQQLGFDLHQAARDLADARPAGWSPDFSGDEGAASREIPKLAPIPAGGPGLDVEDFVRSLFHNVWNRRMLGVLHTTHADNVSFHGPTDRAFEGLEKYQQFLLTLLAVFPDLALKVDQVYWMGNDEEGYLTSVRWHAFGTHLGHGVYGPPTGRRARIWGITQHRIAGGKVVEEWALFNELDLMMQLLGSRTGEDAPG